MLKDPFVLADREYRSRLILGTGKYKDFEETRRAVEVNRDIIPRDEYATCRLQPGDTIEIVHFVGGG